MKYGGRAFPSRNGKVFQIDELGKREKTQESAGGFCFGSRPSLEKLLLATLSSVDDGL